MNYLLDVEAYTTIDYSRQRELLHHKDPIVVRNLAGNPNLLPELMVLLSQNQDALIRYALLHNRGLLPECFKNLFLEFGKDLIENIQYATITFKYQNSKTQELLEKYLLLV